MPDAPSPSSVDLDRADSGVPAPDEAAAAIAPGSDEKTAATGVPAAPSEPPARGGRGGCREVAEAETEAPAVSHPGATASRRMRARLVRLGAQRSNANPVLEPLFRIVRTTHPKADLRLIERAYDVAEATTAASCARAATRSSPTRSPSRRSSPSWA